MNVRIKRWIVEATTKAWGCISINSATLCLRWCSEKQSYRFQGQVHNMKWQESEAATTTLYRRYTMFPHTIEPSVWFEDRIFTLIYLIDTILWWAWIRDQYIAPNRHVEVVRNPSGDGEKFYLLLDHYVLQFSNASHNLRFHAPL